MYVHYGATSICQLPSYNLFTQHVTYLYGETPLVNLWTPVLSFTLIIQSTAIPALSTATIILIYFTANKHRFPHYTSNPLFLARPVRLTTSLYRWGKVLWLCCVQVPRWVRPANVSGINLQKTLFLLLVDSTLVSFWGKTCCYTHHTFLLGFPNTPSTSASIKTFSGAVAGEEEAFCKWSLSLSISLLCFCFA